MVNELGKNIMATLSILFFGAVSRLSYSKYRVLRVLLLGLYYWIVMSRTLKFFMVHLKGEEYAREFREKRRTLGSKVVQ